jgi:hypothetical protein
MLARKMGRLLPWFLVSLGLVPCSLLSCSDGDDAAAIRALIGRGMSLAEAQDLGGLMDLTTDEFLALPGELDQRGTKRILWAAFRHYKRFKVVYPRPDVQLGDEGAAATATFPLLIVKKEQAFPKLDRFYENPQRWMEEVGERADLYRLTLDLVKRGGDWLVEQALLERFKGVAFGT